MSCLCWSENSSDKESDDEGERDPMPEVTEIRFIPDDVDSCEFDSRYPVLIIFDHFVPIFFFI